MLLSRHNGSHTDSYHRWVFFMLNVIDAQANGDRELFLELFNELIKEPLLENPRLPYIK